MELMKLESKDKITSLELTDIINKLRVKEYEHKKKTGTLTEAEIKRGKAVELKHKTLLEIIKNEFSLRGQNFLPTLESRKVPMPKGGYRNEDKYILDFKQARQTLVRESPLVRSYTIEYIDYLETENKSLSGQLKEQRRLIGITTRNKETRALKKLLEYGNIPKEKQGLYYMNYSKIPKRITGWKWKSRNDLTAEQSDIINHIEIVMYDKVMECITDKVPFGLVYHEVLTEATEQYQKWNIPKIGNNNQLI